VVIVAAALLAWLRLVVRLPPANPLRLRLPADAVALPVAVAWEWAAALNASSSTT
jgi:hypothetical protein